MEEISPETYRKRKNCLKNSWEEISKQELRGKDRNQEKKPLDLVTKLLSYWQTLTPAKEWSGPCGERMS